MELELKQLTPYLPYGLRVKEGNTTFEMTGSFLDQWFNYGELGNVKPILRPLSDMDTNDVCWLAHKEEIDYAIEFDTIQEDLPYFIVELMFANHYDVFRLIDNGLAIDINTEEEANNG